MTDKDVCEVQTTSFNSLRNELPSSGETRGSPPDALQTCWLGSEYCFVRLLYTSHQQSPYPCKTSPLNVKLNVGHSWSTLNLWEPTRCYQIRRLTPKSTMAAHILTQRILLTRILFSEIKCSTSPFCAPSHCPSFLRLYKNSNQVSKQGSQWPINRASIVNRLWRTAPSFQDGKEDSQQFTNASHATYCTTVCVRNFTGLTNVAAVSKRSRNTA